MPALRLFVTCLAAVGWLGLMGGGAQAQDFRNCQPGSPNFDRCFANTLGMQQNQLAMAQRQNFQAYLSDNREWLQRNYAQHRANGGQMSFQQFAQWGLSTANGTNYAGALRAQRDRFNGQQQANRTVQEGFASYNAGSAARSAETSRIAKNYGEGAIRGNAPYIDPNSGQTRWLPYGAQPGQQFTSGGETYMQNRNGTYFQQRGNGWVPMNPGR